MNAWARVFLLSEVVRIPVQLLWVSRALRHVHSFGRIMSSRSFKAEFLKHCSVVLILFLSANIAEKNSWTNSKKRLHRDKTIASWVARRANKKRFRRMMCQRPMIVASQALLLRARTELSSKSMLFMMAGKLYLRSFHGRLSFITKSSFTKASARVFSSSFKNSELISLPIEAMSNM